MKTKKEKKKSQNRTQKLSLIKLTPHINKLTRPCYWYSYCTRSRK